MSGIVKVDGTLTAGPPSVSEGLFPAMVATAPLFLKNGLPGKGYQVGTGVLTQRVNAPFPGFAPLTPVGPFGVVSKGDTLYMKCISPMIVRITRQDPLGPDVTYLVPLDGMFFQEFPSNMLLTLLEVQGSGDIEYFVSGQQ